MMDNPSRRKFVAAVGASTVGSVGMSSATAEKTQSDLSDITELEWVTTNTVESDIAPVYVTLTFGYYGSETVYRTIDGDIVERWAHIFEASMCARCEDNCYNIESQNFEALMNQETEFNDGNPTAGAAAWPDPPGGNWSEVAETVLKEALGELVSLVSVAQTADEIMDAYEHEDFDTEHQNELSFEANYLTTRHTASHSVDFIADQPPETNGAIDVYSGVGGTGGVEAYVLMCPKGEDMGTVLPEPDTLDSMSTKELNERGITRIEQSAIERNAEQVRNSRFELNRDGPNYIASFPMEIELGAKGGSVVNR